MFTRITAPRSSLRPAFRSWFSCNSQQCGKLLLCPFRLGRLFYAPRCAPLGGSMFSDRRRARAALLLLMLFRFSVGVNNALPSLGAVLLSFAPRASLSSDRARLLCSNYFSMPCAALASQLRRSGSVFCFRLPSMPERTSLVYFLPLFTH